MISKEDLKDLLSFTKGERNAIVLLFALISCWGMYAFIDKKYSDPTQPMDAEFRAEVNAYLASNGKVESSEDAYPRTSKSRKPTELFVFNPNTTSLEEWKKLGLSEKQAKVILNYRSKGGQFRSKADLKKMYTVSDKNYSAWEPFIDLPEVAEKPEKEWKNTNEKSFKSKPKQEESFKKEVRTYEIEVIDLNRADTTALKKIYGVGSYYAKKIVEYREELGGYLNFDQLGEIWKMREETLEKIRPHVSINSSDIQKIHINTVSADELKVHPYLSYKEAYAIINFRKQHGTFGGIDDLKKIIILSEESIDKIEPYLSYD